LWAVFVWGARGEPGIRRKGAISGANKKGKGWRSKKTPKACYLLVKKGILIKSARSTGERAGGVFGKWEEKEGGAPQSARKGNHYKSKKTLIGRR